MRVCLGLTAMSAPFAFLGVRPEMVNRLIRYLAYLAYLPTAGASWLAILFFGFGFIPVPHERQCDIGPEPCPPTSTIMGILTVIFIFSVVPLTVLGFVLLRNWLHRVQGLNDQEL